METIEKFLKKKIDDYIKKNNVKKSYIIKELGITTQYLNDMENGKRIPSSDLMKKFVNLLGLDDKDKTTLYDLASDGHKIKKIPADIEEFIINNCDAKNKIRELITEMEEK